MEFKRIGRVTICEEIIEYFKKLIANNALEKGTKLPSEGALAEKMGVGRGTIREALKVLIYLGYLERRENGTYVSEHGASEAATNELSEDIKKYRNAIEMIEVRKIIEPEVAALVAEKADEKALAMISEEFLKMEEFFSDIDKFIDHDNKFHVYLVGAIQNRLLEGIMKSIHELMRDSQGLILKEGNIKNRSLDFHRKILIALKEGDADLARSCMLSHISDIESEMYSIIMKGENRT